MQSFPTGAQKVLRVNKVSMRAKKADECAAPFESTFKLPLGEQGIYPQNRPTAFNSLCDSIDQDGFVAQIGCGTFFPLPQTDLA